MNKLEDYLVKATTKDKIMLYSSFPILIFIIYLNFIYTPFTEQESKLIRKKKGLISKVSKIKSTKIKYKILQKEYYKLQTEIEKLYQDFRYAKISFSSLEIMKLNQMKFTTIIEKLLKDAKRLNIDVSLTIKYNFKPNKYFDNSVYIILDGKGDYLACIKYLRDIENIKSIVMIEEASISEVTKDLNAVKKLEDKAKSSFSFRLSVSKRDPLDFMSYLQNMAKSMKVSLSTHLEDGLIYVSGKAETNNMKSFIRSVKQFRNVKISRENVSLSAIDTNYNDKDSINSKKFQIKFNLLGLK